MGEEPSPHHFAELQQYGTSLSAPFPFPAPQANGSAHPQQDDEDGTIKCICGFDDDDGNTVLCEGCETWQHIECYYYPHLDVPDIHQCTECHPRDLDSTSAAQRQRRRLREGLNSTDDRKAKRSAPKTHKRSKTKDPAAFAASSSSSHPQVNGNPPNDRASGSPRDQPPPSKRAKTNHKNSNSVSAINTTTASAAATTNHNNNNHHSHGHRNGSGSMSAPLQSPTKPSLSECPPDYFSPEFIRVHRENSDFSPAQANLFLNIGISDLLSTWLDDPEAFALATNGRSHADVFKQHPSPIEELETPVKKHIREDRSVQFHGAHPIWPYLAADRDILEGHFVGELIGSIGHINDYKADSANDWDRLRHPSHFVFFHPHLPIYIDCRTEGTVLRYARRSCRPNVKIETLITGARELHFCFIATSDIPQDAEITVAWDLESDPQIRDYLNRLSNSASSVDDSHRDYISRFIGTVLAHFGDCACEHAYDDHPCYIGRFDRRLEHLKPGPHPPQALVPKKKQTPRRSPSRPQRGLNSRATSETVPQEFDEDMPDAASSPRSSRSRTSREHSPALYDAPPELPPGLSERDKKKLIQQEKLFQKIEQEQEGKKKKRRSGSTLNTPTAPSMVSDKDGYQSHEEFSVKRYKKQGHRAYYSASDASTPVPGVKLRIADNGHGYFPSLALQSSAEHSPQAQSPAPRAKPEHFHRHPKPVYVDAASQTEDTDSCTPISPLLRTNRREPFIPLSQRLLRRNHLAKKWSRIQVADKLDGQLQPLTLSEQLGDRTINPGDAMDITQEGNSSDQVVDMQELPDADEGAKDLLTHGQAEVGGNKAVANNQSMPSPDQSFAPPWPKVDTGTSTDGLHGEPQRNNFRATKFHVDLPPREFLPQAGSGPSTVSEGTNQSVLSPRTMGSLAPMSAPIATMGPPLMTPTQSTATQPSPIKKKMSLSDYSQRLKAKTPIIEKSQGQSQAEGGASAAEQSPTDSNAETGDGSGSSPVESIAGSTAVKSEPETGGP